VVVLGCVGAWLLVGVNQPHLTRKPTSQGYFNTMKLRINFLAMSLVKYMRRHLSLEVSSNFAAEHEVSPVTLTKSNSKTVYWDKQNKNWYPNTKCTEVFQDYVC